MMRLAERTFMRSRLLLVDAAIDLALGALLVVFPRRVIELLGVPAAADRFYPSILGAVLVGIGLALLIECYRRPGAPAGLGLAGAIVTNLVASAVLAVWLVFGGLELPWRGHAILWGVVVVVTSLSLFEVRACRRAGAE